MTKKIKWIISVFCLFPLASLSMISCVQKTSTIPINTSNEKDDNSTQVSNSDYLNSQATKTNADSSSNSDSKDQNLNENKHAEDLSKNKFDENSSKDKPVENLPNPEFSKKDFEKPKTNDKILEESSKNNDSTNVSKNFKEVYSSVTYEELLNKVNSVLKVKFDSEEEKPKTLNLINAFFDRIASGTRSNGVLAGNLYINLLKEKISTSLIKNNHDVNDKFNFLMVDDLIKEIDYNLDKFNFSDSSKDSTIDSIYKPHLDFFKRSIFVTTDSPFNFNPGPEGIEVWTKRVFWPSLQYGIAYKLNGIDQRSKTNSGSLNTEFNFLWASLKKNNLIINKIIYITNQILISIFNYYKLFLNASKHEEKKLKLIKIFVLLQALFYGKNAKEIFKQFLKNNENYKVENFITNLKQKNFGNKEPDYLKNIIDEKSNKKSYENLLMYLNYLNFNYDKTTVKDSYVNSKNFQDPSYSGAFSWSASDDKNWYKNKTIFSVIKRNEQKQIIDVDFNQFFI